MIGRSRAVRVRVGAALAVAMIVAMSAGCGDGDFVPPPPPETGDSIGSRDVAPGASIPKAGTASTASAATVRRIDFIAPRRMDPIESAVEIAAARTQAGYDHARLHVRPDDDVAGAPDASASRDKSQAELIRVSIAQKASAVIVDPDDPDDKELAHAVREARAAGVPVVVVGRPIAGAGELKAAGMAPMVLVAPPPFGQSARRLVELSIRNLKNDKVDPSGGAIILVTTPADRFAADRAAAIRQALADAKITPVSELRIPKDLEAAAVSLTGKLDENRKLALVFFTDYNGSLASNNVAAKISEKRPYVQAGYAADETRVRMVRAGNYAAIAEYEPTRLIRKAVSVAIAAAQGRESKDREEILIGVAESPTGAGVAHVVEKRSAVFKAGGGSKKDD